MHTSLREEGIEDEALARFKTLLADHRIDTSSVRLFGWNVQLEGEDGPFGYQMVSLSWSR